MEGVQGTTYVSESENLQGFISDKIKSDFDEISSEIKGSYSESVTTENLKRWQAVLGKILSSLVGQHASKDWHSFQNEVQNMGDYLKANPSEEVKEAFHLFQDHVENIGNHLDAITLQKVSLLMISLHLISNGDTLKNYASTPEGSWVNS